MRKPGELQRWHHDLRGDDVIHQVQDGRDVFTQADARIDVERELAALTELQRAIARLLVEFDCTKEELPGILGCSRATVFRELAKMRRTLGRETFSAARPISIGDGEERPHRAAGDPR
jgi:DNA-directed RNA polymerase specialized sigma24 family protein